MATLKKCMRQGRMVGDIGQKFCPVSFYHQIEKKYANFLWKRCSWMYENRQRFANYLLHKKDDDDE